MPTNERSSSAVEVEDLAGLDALDVPVGPAPTRLRRIWSATWPQAAAVAVALLAWQIVAWTNWKPSWVLPGPGPTFRRLATDTVHLRLIRAAATTMRRAAVGFG